jgi:adenylate kinase family enzyme
MFGKGTVCEDLKSNSGFVFLSTGDGYRAMADDPEMGPIIASYQDLGIFVPDDIHIPIFRSAWARLIALNWGKNLGLDGALRTPGQAEALMPLVELIAPSYDIVQLSIRVQPDELWRRHQLVLAGLDPKRNGRNDDKKREVFKTRQEEHNNKTVPMEKMISERGIKTVEIPVGYNRPKEEMIMRVRTALDLPMLVRS